MKAEVTTLMDGKIRLLSLEGEIDFSVVPQLREAIEAAWLADPAAVLIDLSRVSFIASDGLGALIEANQQATGNGRKLDLVHPQPHILDLLRKTQLTRIFEVFDSVDDALAGCC